MFNLQNYYLDTVSFHERTSSESNKSIMIVNHFEKIIYFLNLSILKNSIRI